MTTSAIVTALSESYSHTVPLPGRERLAAQQAVARTARLILQNLQKEGIHEDYNSWFIPRELRDLITVQNRMAKAHESKDPFNPTSGDLTPFITERLVAAQEANAIKEPLEDVECTVRNISVISYATGYTHWFYRTTHSLAQVSQLGYFNLASGMVSHMDLVSIHCADGLAMRAFSKSEDRIYLEGLI